MIDAKAVNDAIAEVAPAAIALAESLRSDPELSGEELH